MNTIAIQALRTAVAATVNLLENADADEFDAAKVEVKCHNALKLADSHLNLGPTNALMLGMRLDVFDAVECHLVCDHRGIIEQIDEDAIGAIEGGKYLWSVFLHYDEKHPANSELQGIECVADFPTKKAAEAFSMGLAAALAEVRAADLRGELETYTPLIHTPAA